MQTKVSFSVAAAACTSSVEATLCAGMRSLEADGAIPTEAASC